MKIKFTLSIALVTLVSVLFTSCSGGSSSSSVNDLGAANYQTSYYSSDVSSESQLSSESTLQSSSSSKIDNTSSSKVVKSTSAAESVKSSGSSAPKTKAYSSHSSSYKAKSFVAENNSSDSQSVTVYITRTGHKYHRAGCRYLKRSEFAISLKEAKADGYTACSVCDPPQ